MKIGLLGFGGNGILAGVGVVNNAAVFLLKSPTSALASAAARSETKREAEALL